MNVKLIVLVLAAFLVSSCEEETPSESDTAMDVSSDGVVNDTTTDSSEDAVDSTEDGAETDAQDTTELPLTCEPECGANSTCVEGSCVCDRDFEDCNGEASDGCETNLGEVATCGGCEPDIGCSVYGMIPDCDRVDDTFACNIADQSCGSPDDDFLYVDLNGDTDPVCDGFPCTPPDPETSDGCEIGRKEDVRWTLSDAGLSGAIQDFALDGDMMVVAFTDGSDGDVAKLVRLDTTGEFDWSAVGAVEDLQFGLGSNGRFRVAASNGVVMAGVDRDIFVFETDTDDALVKVRQETLINVGDIELISPGVFSASVAEFAVVGDGTRWYGVFAPGDEPEGATCNNESGSTLRLCILGTSDSPSAGDAVTTMALDGQRFLIASGDTHAEFLLDDATPQLTPQSTTGDAFGDSAFLRSFSDGVVYSAEGDQTVRRYMYTTDTGSLSTRSVSAQTTEVGEAGNGVVAFAALPSSVHVFIIQRFIGLIDWEERVDSAMDAEENPLLTIFATGDAYYVASPVDITRFDYVVAPE